MTQTVLEKILSPGDVWIELPGIRIENRSRRKLDRGVLESLRRQIEAGLAARPDPRRANFFEASVDGYWVYLYVTPAKVYLLARVANVASQ